MFFPLLTRFKMLHLVRFITWLLVFLPLSQVEGNVDSTENNGPPDGTLSEDNQSDASFKTAIGSEDIFDASNMMTDDDKLHHHFFQPVTDTSNSPLVKAITEPKAKCTSWSCFAKTGLGIAIRTVGILSALYFWDYIIKRVYSPGNGTTKINPNTTRPPTWPLLSPEIEDSSSTFWWIVSIGGVAAFLGLLYWKYYHSHDDESSETDQEKVAKKKQPKVKEKSKKERSKVKVKNGISSPVSKATPSSAVPSSNASKATLSSQTGTESLVTQTSSPQAAANKTKLLKSAEKKKETEKFKADVTTNVKCTTSAFPASASPSNGASAASYGAWAASTSPQTSTAALTWTPTWDAPTLQTTPPLPSNAAASKQTKQTPSSVATPTKLSQSLQKMKHSNAANKTKPSTETKKEKIKPDVTASPDSASPSNGASAATTLSEVSIFSRSNAETNPKKTTSL